jgi:hypothetical protein
MMSTGRRGAEVSMPFAAHTDRAGTEPSPQVHRPGPDAGAGRLKRAPTPQPAGCRSPSERSVDVSIKP